MKTYGLMLMGLGLTTYVALASQKRYNVLKDSSIFVKQRYLFSLLGLGACGLGIYGVVYNKMSSLPGRLGCWLTSHISLGLSCAPLYHIGGLFLI
eukprot:UN27354